MKKYDDLLVEFKKVLKQNRLKYTIQRGVILKVLFDTDKHITPEELYDLVKLESPNLKTGIATVYRTLTLLEDNRIVNSITFGAMGKKYELSDKPHHDHLICDNCGLIIEFEDNEIEKKQCAIAENYDFEIKSHIMQLHGICKECRRKE